MRVCSRPAAASFSVPSPANTATTSKSSSAAARASSVACPRREVSATSTSWSRRQDLADLARLRGVTDDAVELTSRSTRIGPGGYRPARRRIRSVVEVRARDLDRARAARSRECRACPRLVEWREQVAREKRASFRDETYWARPVPGFGDPDARVLIVGLAPAAHGGNRTGRVFTGDRSGDFLFASMFRCGFANQPTSVALDDGLVLRDAYVAAAVRCAPPANKPTPAERDECAPYLRRELELLDRVRVIVALGAFGYEAVWSAFRADRGLGGRAARPAAAVRAPAGSAVRTGDRCSARSTRVSRTRSPAGSRRTCSTRCSRARQTLRAARGSRRPRRSPR